MAENENLRGRAPLLARLNEKAKRLNDVKVNTLTVLIFFACIAALAAAATGVGFIVHKAAKSFERPLRQPLPDRGPIAH